MCVCVYVYTYTLLTYPTVYLLPDGCMFFGEWHSEPKVISFGGLLEVLQPCPTVSPEEKRTDAVTTRLPSRGLPP